LDRHVAELGVPLRDRQFVGAAETTAAGGSTTVTVLFAAAWPRGTPVPEAWQGHRVTAAHVDVLLSTRLAPLPVAWVVRRWLADGWPMWRGEPAAQGGGWARLRPSVASLRAQLAGRREALHGGEFRDAAVAMCALVTAADGRIDPAEQEGMLAFVANDPVMAHFPTAEVQELFDAHLARLTTDFPTGKAAALADIAKVRGRASEARAVIQVGEVIGRIDGAFAASERAVVREAIDALGLDPADFTVGPPLPAVGS
jgi:tellurite resistance protein